MLILVRSEVLRDEYTAMLSSINIVGLARTLRGKYKEAETMHR
jgi:hypothetical protein